MQKRWPTRRNDTIAPEAVRDHFDRVNATLRGLEKMHADSEPLTLDALARFAARAYRRPLSKAERDDLLAYYHTLRTKNELTHESAVRECVVSVLMSPDFLYRIDLLDSRSAAAGSTLRNVDYKPAAGVTGRPLSAYAWRAG